MFRVIAVLALICCVFSCQVKDVSFSEAQNPCTREILQAKVDAYIDALKKGESSLMPLAPGAKYIENTKEAPFEEGVWQEPLVVDFHRSLLDTELCETYTEIISASGSHPYVIGTRLKITGDRIAEVEALVTDDDDWLFNASNYLKYSPQENWSILPSEMRSDRQTLIRVANAYFDVFKDPSSANDVPWNIPCARLEGGIYTNPANKPDASCTEAPPWKAVWRLPTGGLLSMSIWERLWDWRISAMKTAGPTPTYSGWKTGRCVTSTP